MNAGGHPRLFDAEKRAADLEHAAAHATPREPVHK